MIWQLDALLKELNEVREELDVIGFDNADVINQVPVYPQEWFVVEDLHEELEKNMEALELTLMSINDFLFKRRNHSERK